MRFVAYDDQIFEERDGSVWTERTFPLFIAEVGAHLDRLVLVGRVSAGDSGGNFRLPDGTNFTALPYYDSLVDLGSVLRGFLGAARVFWRSLDEADGAWVLGPHPLGLLFALLTIARRKRLVLGVRQELTSYVRRRHPNRRLVQLSAVLLEACWRGLARANSAVVVGPALKEQYRHAGRLHELHVSMMRSSQIVGPEVAERKRYDEALTILSVGRLDEEKNPLMLADVLASLRSSGKPWRLVVCGTGSCEAELAARLSELGVADAAELRGYVPLGAGLRELYLEAQAFLHVSWTEGVPQVLFEAFASRLPVVATEVGGVGAAAGTGEAILIPPGDPVAAVEALEAIADDPELRDRLTGCGAAQAQRHSMEAEAEAAAAFLAA